MWLKFLNDFHLERGGGWSAKADLAPFLWRVSLAESFPILQMPLLTVLVANVQKLLSEEIVIINNWVYVCM